MDPTLKLKELINEKYKKELKNKKFITGGILPLVAIGTAAAGALAGKITIELYDFLKKKLTGKGIEFNHTTHNEKKLFLQDFLKKKYKKN